MIGRNTAFTYKGKPVDLKQIGRELNVRYVLEGSVQRGGDRMRVNVQLIDTETGNHLWAERFDKPLADLFDMQDEIVARLAGALNTELVAAEARRAEQTPNPNSIDLYFQGLAWFYKGLTPDNMAQARSFFDRALAADPDNVDALVGSARVDQVEGVFFFVTDRAAAFAAAEAKLTKALSAAPDHARGHMQLGFVDIYTERAAEGITKCEHALKLDRNLAYAHAYIGIGKIFIGRAEETESHIAEALRLSPRDTMAYVWFAIGGTAKRHLGLWEEAVAWFRRSIEANRNFPESHFELAAALTQLGRLDDARSAVRAGLALDPNFSVSRARAFFTAESRDPKYLARTERLLEGLHKAGFRKTEASLKARKRERVRCSSLVDWLVYPRLGDHAGLNALPQQAHAAGRIRGGISRTATPWIRHRSCDHIATAASAMTATSPAAPARAIPPVRASRRDDGPSLAVAFDQMSVPESAQPLAGRRLPHLHL